MSRATVRRLRLALGRAPRRRRERAPAMGQLVQLDASPFAWFEARGPLATLHGLIDDATSGPLALWFRPTEDVHGYLSVLGQACRAYGVPVTLYGDRLSLFQRNDPHWSLEEDLRGHQDPTHFGRVLEELGIGFLQAQSPQAKGRIERLWGTLQDRLVSELRLRGVATLEAANAFLPTFLADFVRRFACPPATPAPAWRPAPRDLERLLSCRYQRTVARDNTVRLGPRCVQLPPGPRGRSHAGGRVEVRELLDGRLLVFAHGALLATQPAPGPDFVLTPRRAAGDARRQAARQRRRRTRQLHQALARLATVARPRPGGARTAVEAGGRSLDTPGPTTRPSPRAPPPREPAATAPRSLWTPPRTHPWRRGVTPRGRALRAAWKG